MLLEFTLMLMEMVLEDGNGDQVLWRTITQELSLSENLQKKKTDFLMHMLLPVLCCAN